MTINEYATRALKVLSVFLFEDQFFFLVAFFCLEVSPDGHVAAVGGD